jgi:hypothetical protein
MKPAATTHVMQTNLPLPNRRQGKVRDVYQFPQSPGSLPRMLIVASDRISAFDVVLPTPRTRRASRPRRARPRKPCGTAPWMSSC